MKIFLTALIIAILISGCGTRNAFSKLNIEPEQEKAIENTRSWKITSQDNVTGVFSAVYLNNVYKNMSKNTNEFYLSIYLKDKNHDLNITLNKKIPLKMEKLTSENKFSNLLPMKNEWAKNYLVSFKNIENDDNNASDELILQIDSGQFSSGQLKYSKDQL
jgi:hypothetical protein